MISAELLAEINEAFPNLIVIANNVPQYIVRYIDWDNTVLYRAVVAEGANAVNAVTAGYITAPTKEGTDDTHYTFKDFGTLPTNIHGNETVVAQYTTTYRVRFMNGDTAYDTQWVAAGGSATAPTGTPTKASTAQYTYTFSGWDKSYTNVTAPLTVNAVYTSALRYYTVYFYNGSTLLQTVENVPYGGTATFTGTTPVDPSGDGGEFEGWSPSNTNITGATSCYAQFASALEVAEITDSWDTILAAVSDGTYRQKYKVGNYKPLDLGSEGTVNMQIAGFDKDTLADGSGKAPITWISKELLATSHRMNPTDKSDDWGMCEMRTYLKETIKPLIPAEVRTVIKTVSKTQEAFSSESLTQSDDVWIPSSEELYTYCSPYKTLFPDNPYLKKHKVGSEKYIWWYTRTSCAGRGTYYSVNDDGGENYYNYGSGGVALGFCT